MKTPKLINELLRTDEYQNNTMLPTEDNSVSSDNVEVFFRDIKEQLIQRIRRADILFGAVAWLTDLEILDALAEKPTCMVVQKEDFLRPDKVSFIKLHIAYNKLRGPCRIQMGGLAGELTTNGSSAEDTMVRCVGNYNRTRRPAFPRMHNKFLVMCSTNELEEHIPYAVWTGSFNFTNNSSNSLENAVYIQDRVIAEAYHKEWCQIFALSEPLNWEHDWCAPEYRIGT